MPIEHPRKLELETPLCAGHPVVVAAPRTAHGRGTADRVCQALMDLGAGAMLVEDPPFEALSEADGPVIVVGNLADNRCIRALYFRFLCATDLWYPGPGGYELRTLCSPFGTGYNVLLVGYSDAKGAEDACEALLSRLVDPVPHLAALQVTRLPLASNEMEQIRSQSLPPTAWQMANTDLGDRKGYLYYLTGEMQLGEDFRTAWKGVLESGYEKTDRIVQAHLYSLSRWLPWRLVEDMDLFSESERLEITRFVYGWAESDEGWKHVARCPRVVSMHVPRQNHELVPALALMHAASYFSTHYPALPGPDRWLEPAKRAYTLYGASWKPLCDGLCHGWWMSQPAMVEQGLFDLGHGYFEQGGARRAAECALAVVNNEGWLPSAGDGDLGRQFPGPSLRAAAAYYGDGRYRFVHDLATPDRRLAWLTTPPRAYDSGIEGVVPNDAVGVTVIPVDPVVYQVWERDPEAASGVVTTPPAARIESCFDKISVRTGWTSEDDFLLIDGLGGGSHSYDDAGAILEYARLGLSLIVQEDSFVHSAPEHHSAVTIVRDGEAGVIPGFASLEANEARDDGTVYLRVRLKDYAGADWVREVLLIPGRCAVFVDTVTANQAGNYAVEARFRTPARFELDGGEARSARRSPVAGDVAFRIGSSCESAQLAISEDPVHLRYQSERDQGLWRDRYQTDAVVLSTLVARKAVRLEAGEGVQFAHVAQALENGDAPIKIADSEDGLRLIDGRSTRDLKTAGLRRAQAAQKTGGIRPSHGRSPIVVAEPESPVRALCPVEGGTLAVGTAGGEVVLIGDGGEIIWSRDLEGPVHDIGVAEDGSPLIAVGHGKRTLTTLDTDGSEAWSADIERDPCPWPWWELPTPAAVQVAGGVDQGEAFFAVGCGDIQIRCFGARGEERWRQRYNEGVPGRVRVAEVDGSGAPRILAGGEILSDTSTCRILDTGGSILAHLSVEGWTSVLTALEIGAFDGRHLVACGANRGKNLHLFALDGGAGEGSDPSAWDRVWLARLGGRVNGIRICPSSGRLLAGTSKGFLLCYDLAGALLWHRLLDEGIDHVVALGDGALVCTAGGALMEVSTDGKVGECGRLGGPCTHARRADDRIYLACDRSVWTVATS